MFIRHYPHLGPFGEDLSGGAREVDLGVGVVVGLEERVAAAALRRAERHDLVHPHRALGRLVNGRLRVKVIH